MVFCGVLQESLFDVPESKYLQDIERPLLLDIKRPSCRTSQDIKKRKTFPAGINLAVVSALDADADFRHGHVCTCFHMSCICPDIFFS